MFSRSIGSIGSLKRGRAIAATQVLGLISYPSRSSAFTIASACLIATRASTLCPLSLTCSARAPAITLSTNGHEAPHNAEVTTVERLTTCVGAGDGHGKTWQRKGWDPDPMRSFLDTGATAMENTGR